MSSLGTLVSKATESGGLAPGAPPPVSTFSFFICVDELPIHWYSGGNSHSLML